jgi:hypothetical protein
MTSTETSLNMDPIELADDDRCINLPGRSKTGGEVGFTNIADWLGGGWESMMGAHDPMV